MSNPLLEDHHLPPFSRILPEHVEPAVSQLIEGNKAAISDLLAKAEALDATELLRKIEDLGDELERCWAPVSHLNGVMNNDELRDAYNRCLSLLSDYSTWIGQNAELFAAYKNIADSAEFSDLDAAQRQAVNNALRDFRLAGIDLPPAEQQRYGELKQRLATLGSSFNENLLDATRAWTKNVTLEELSGLPESALESARQAALDAGQEGYLLTLDFPSLLPVLTYCDNAALRQEVYTANVTRASDQGPQAGQWDNSELIDEILDLRLELAQLLGFENYSELSLATKMAESPEQVLDFLEQLAERSRPQAQQEWQALSEFAATEFKHHELQAWDVAYYGEKLKQSRYQVSQEEIRPYLPLDTVLNGLFALSHKLFGIEIVEIESFDSYHPDLRLFEIRRDGRLQAQFYLDLYARSGKRGGAWMADCRVRRLRDSQLQLPVAFLVCNFNPPVGDKAALLTEDELTTLFHEFGHGLHHMLTQQDVAAVSGINGVAWDAVELPSQFLENWCYEPEALAFITGHFETGQSLPQELLEKMLAAKNFQSAMMMVRQLEFALFDFKLHQQWGSANAQPVQALLDQVRQEVAVIIPPQFNRFQHSFAHIFAGGYAAGYYSYKWAEVLSADAFSRFEEDGIFNPNTGAEFRDKILAVGGSQDPMAMFVAFRGREPKVEALLRHSGIKAA
ncbi:oligopeptidase A [Parahaliea sp. F7430]|uniref:oligopeptidase A n=1 Tax=Sediminihaliea albiluteola TaxID=2758564 RepID=A0A7W2TVQ2_9GAMM|nr:oligopeptidase A [Sediminihaliea albiluteola]MBA6412795.1 oligopeptidase A [Sediminihaliea albiluteola]